MLLFIPLEKMALPGDLRTSVKENESRQGKVGF